MSLFKSLFSPTYWNIVRWRYVAINFGGILVCFIADNRLAFILWVIGWIYGMEWQRVKTAEGLANKGEDE